MHKDEDIPSSYPVSAAMLRLIASHQVGIPARRLLHALLILHKREPLRETSVDASWLIANFWREGCKDHREIKKGITKLQWLDLFETLELGGRQLHVRWQEEQLSALSIKPAEGFAQIETDQIRGFRSEYQFRLYELIRLHARKDTPKFLLPGIDREGAFGYVWADVREQWLKAAEVMSKREGRLLVGVISKATTRDVLRVAVKIENASSRWQPGALYPFATQPGEVVDLIRIVDGVRTRIPLWDARKLSPATRLDPETTKKFLGR